MSRSEHIRKKLSTLPYKPGICLMRHCFRRLIHMGRAKPTIRANA